MSVQIANMGNLFRTQSGKLDKQYLRTCAVYKLFRSGKIGKERAIELMTVPNGRATVEIWNTLKR